MPNDNNLFPILYNTSRSAIEEGWRCPRRRYLQYHHEGIGIVPNGSDIYLSTGSSLHIGIESLAKQIIKNKQAPILIEGVDIAVAKAISYYRKNVTKESLSGGGLSTPEGKAFAWEEQQAIIEAMIRVWSKVEMPYLVKRFRILAVEKDTYSTLTEGDGFKVNLETKTDLLLEDRKTRDCYVYSLKGLKRYNDRTEGNYRRDLQGITEIWGAEKFIKQRNKRLVEGDGKRKWRERIQGVKFCILLKGERKEGTEIDGSPSGIWFTYNPFVRGYRSISASTSGIKYAHSWFVENDKNKSGKGTLGKGWEPFYVWRDYKGGIKKWIRDIAAGEIQPNYSSKGPTEIFNQWCVTPQEVFRDEVILRQRMMQLRSEEGEWFHRVNRFEYEKIQEGESFNRQVWLDNYFPQHSISCSFPQECDYTPICWADSYGKGVELEQAVKSSYYKWREPHHDRERERVRGILDGQTNSNNR